MSLLQRLDRAWYMPAPAERLSMLRIFVGLYALLYLLIRAPNLTSVARFAAAEFEPIGVVHLLRAPLAPAFVYVLWILASVSGVAFTTGLWYRLSGPAFALSFLWVTSYRSAWGMIFHNENLPALHLVLLALAPAAEVLSIDARGGTVAPREASGRYGWAIRAISAVTVVSYVIAGCAKLRLAGPAWLDGELLRAHVAYDNLRKIELGSIHSPFGAWLVKYAWPFSGLAALSLALELGAPLALLHDRMGRIWALGVFGFHVGVLALMAIAFPYQLTFVAYLSFVPLERVAGRLRRRVPASAARPAPTSGECR